MFDARDRVLFEAVERNEPRPPGTPVGRCLVLHLATELNQRPLTAVLGPGSDPLVAPYLHRPAPPTGHFDR